MTTFTQFSEMIERLLGGARCVRITVDGYMPLVAEEIGASADGRRLVALAHTAVQNGDVMHDPEIVFERSLDRHADRAQPGDERLGQRERDSRGGTEVGGAAGQ